jgi:hypothetical protein
MSASLTTHFLIDFLGWSGLADIESQIEFGCESIESAVFLCVDSQAKLGIAS